MTVKICGDCGLVHKNKQDNESCIKCGGKLEAENWDKYISRKERDFNKGVKDGKALKF